MKEKGRQGFASMDPAKQRELASKGGKSAHAKGVAHQWTSQEAQVAGHKGGQRRARLQADRVLDREEARLP